MKKLVVAVLIAVIGITFSSCKKDENNPVSLDAGTYIGEFKVTCNKTVYTGHTKLIIERDKYSATAGDNRFPAGGSGIYTVNNTKITFADQNHWTADFDWGLILTGEYEYSFDGKNLKLKRVSDGDLLTTTYEYNLSKSVIEHN